MNLIPAILIILLVGVVDAETSADFEVSLTLGNETPTTTTLPPTGGGGGGAGGTSGIQRLEANITTANATSTGANMTTYEPPIMEEEKEWGIIPSILSLMLAVFVYFTMVKKPEKEKKETQPPSERRKKSIADKLYEWLRKITSNKTNARRRSAG
jgi:hypothetical protein